MVETRSRRANGQFKPFGSAVASGFFKKRKKKAAPAGPSKQYCSDQGRAVGQAPGKGAGTHLERCRKDRRKKKK